MRQTEKKEGRGNTVVLFIIQLNNLIKRQMWQLIRNIQLYVAYRRYNLNIRRHAYMMYKANTNQIKLCVGMVWGEAGFKARSIIRK